MKKRALALLLTSVMAVGMFAGCGAKEEAAETGKETESESEDKADSNKSDLGTSEAGKFVVGFDQEFPPMGFVGEDGEFTGFDLELAQEVAERMGVEFVPQPITWDA